MLYPSAPYVLLDLIAREAGETGVWEDGWFKAIGKPEAWTKDWALDFAYVKSFEMDYPVLPRENWPDSMIKMRKRTYAYNLFIAVCLMRHKRERYYPDPRLDDHYPPGSLETLTSDFEDFLDF